MKKLLCVGALVLSGCACEEIDAGHIGVIKQFGAIQGTMPEGLNSKNIFADVVEVNLQTGPMASEAIGASKDLQAVHTKITLQYAPTADKAVCLVQKFGSDDGAWSGGILEPAIQEVVKAVSARYTAEELVVKRAEVKLAIEQGINDFIAKTLHARGCDNGIRIANVAVTNFEFSHEFNASIEAKVKAEQDALRAENEKRTRITQAEAKAKEQTLAAEAEAYSTDVQSKTRAAAIEREAKALRDNPALIQLRLVERWNGALPQVSSGAAQLLQLPQVK